MHSHPYLPEHELRDGRLYVRGRHKFLKTGKPLRNYAKAEDVDGLILDLPKLLSKHYSNIAINCYWHHFNPSGDGRIEVSLEPLKRLLSALRECGMYASLSVETYGVGGGQIPQGFWERVDGAVAVNHEGMIVSDTEYGYNSAVPSLYSVAYQSAARTYMKNLVAGLGAENFLYFETTVEPQYMGAQWLDYGNAAREAYRGWASVNEEMEPLPFPSEFPANDTFLYSRAWNIFRSQQLAKWVNGDARALKAGAADAPLWIAVDYLDAEEDTMIKRLGDPTEFLRNLTDCTILQVNWSWCNIRRVPNTKAYERVHDVCRRYHKDWAIAEHMTINGTDYHPEDIEALLKNTLHNGTRFGWEFVDIGPDLDDPSTFPNQVLPGDFKPQHFRLYDQNWDPKPTMQIIESNWEHWMRLATQQQA